MTKDGKASIYNVRDLGLIPGLGRFLGEGNGNPLQYSCLENPMDGGAWCSLLFMESQRVGSTERLHFHFLSYHEHTPFSVMVALSIQLYSIHCSFCLFVCLSLWKILNSSFSAGWTFPLCFLPNLKFKVLFPHIDLFISLILAECSWFAQIRIMDRWRVKKRESQETVLSIYVEE